MQVVPNTTTGTAPTPPAPYALPRRERQILDLVDSRLLETAPYPAAS